MQNYHSHLRQAAPQRVLDKLMTNSALKKPMKSKAYHDASCIALGASPEQVVGPYLWTIGERRPLVTQITQYV